MSGDVANGQHLGRKCPWVGAKARFPIVKLPSQPDNATLERLDASDAGVLFRYVAFGLHPGISLAGIQDTISFAVLTSRE